MRLDDVNYIDHRLDGVPEPPGVLGPVEFYQGEDVKFEVFLTLNNKPITLDVWDIDVIVKKNIYAKNILWHGVLNDGLYPSPKVTGYYTIILPAEDTATFLAGSYWMDVFIHEKVGVNRGPKDLNIIILRQSFSIDYSAASPNPGTTLDGNETEQTYPPPIDTTKT